MMKKPPSSTSPRLNGVTFKVKEGAMIATPIMLTLDNGRRIPAVTLPPDSPLTGLAQALSIPPVNGAIAIVGGAAAFDKPEYTRVRQQVIALVDELADLAIAYQLAIVDGGTPYGAMRLMGEACYARNYRFPLIGVVPNGKVAWTPNIGMNYQYTWYGGMEIQKLAAEVRKTPLDKHHSAFVLVEANEWGDEVEMLAATAHELAGKYGSLEVLINGGEVARRDVTAYLKHGGQVIVVEGTGRFADELALACRTGYSPDPKVTEVLETKRIHVFALGDPPKLFINKLLDLAKWQFPTTAR
jgi:hypothetical protein